MCGVRTAIVVEADPLADAPARIAAAGEGPQVDALVFQGPPQPFDKDIVGETSPPGHRDADSGVAQPPRPHPGRDPTALCSRWRSDQWRSDQWRSALAIEYPEYLRRSVPVQGFLRRVDAELTVHGVREPPCQGRPAPPVHDRHQIQEALGQRDTSGIPAGYRRDTGGI